MIARTAYSIVIAACLLGGSVARVCAEVRFPKLISHHAVLQRDSPIHLWGWSTPGAHLLAHFHLQTAPAIADDIGRWSLYLQPESGGGPYTLTVSGDGPDNTLNDVLVGDVWLASGQSNMEFPLQGFGPDTPLKNQEKEISAALRPNLRLLRVQPMSSDVPAQDITSSWTMCTPETARSFSAVAYFFGREISEREKVPVGLIDISYGGTPADAWVSMDTLGNDARLQRAFASRATFANRSAGLEAVWAEEKREDEAAKTAGRPIPRHPWHPNPSSWMPSGLYNGMIAPFVPMTIKGFLWYQGEANAGLDRAPFYSDLLAALIGDWRMHFEQGNLPFLFVQISSFNAPTEEWPTVRDQQRRTLNVANTAMAVSLDVGDVTNVHPSDKQTIGARLALAARALAYGEAIDYQGPLFRQATSESSPDGSNAMRVWFDHGQGLNMQGKLVEGFEIAGEDRHFVPASATIQGTTVLVKSNIVKDPMFVRFGWNSVVRDSLYNANGLPASTFTSESTVQFSSSSK